MYRRIGKYVPLLLGLLFLYSGVYKLVSPGEATYALVSLDLPGWVARWAIIVVTALEFYLGIVLVRKIDVRYGLVAAMVLMLAFTAFLWYLSSLAHPPKCGCLGLTWAFGTGKKGAVIGIARNCIILWLLKISYDYYFGTTEAPPSTARPLPGTGGPAQAGGVTVAPPGVA